MKISIKKEIIRQLIHLSGLFFVIISYFLTFKQLLAFMLLAITFSTFYCYFLKYFQKITLLGNLSEIIHKFSRKYEQEAKIYLGALYFFFGVTLVLLIFQDLQIFRSATLVLVLGDSFSTITGKLYGNHKILYNKSKSVEGSAAGFFAAFIGLLTQLILPFALLVAFIGMLVESLPWKLNDNFTIPLAVGFVIWFIV